MNALLAVIPNWQESSRPDIAWIKKNVPVLEVGKALGLRIRHRRAKCWRPENHTHGDADPSLHFYEKGNRVRCFVCDMRGGHSNVDLVMRVLGVNVGDAVRWIADRFPVPNVKPGRPLGQREAQAVPYRVGAHGSEFEVLVRSGMFGRLPAPERSILVALAHFRDSDSGLAQLSYAAPTLRRGCEQGNCGESVKAVGKAACNRNPSRLESWHYAEMQHVPRHPRRSKVPRFVQRGLQNQPRPNCPRAQLSP